MKRIISLTLVLLMLVAMLCTVTSCEFGMESMTGFTQLRDYVMSKEGDRELLNGNGLSAIGVYYNEDEGKNYVQASICGETTKEYLYVTLSLTGSTEKAEMVYQVVDKATSQPVCEGAADILLTHYTGDDLVSFLDTNNLFTYEFVHREYATILLNRLLVDLDVYMNKNLDLNVRDLGFIVLSDKYMAPTDEVEVEEDLGGAFSSARLKKAGLMLLQGIGMVFLVLAILWIVLLIFKAVFAKDSAKAEKENKAAAKAAAKEAAKVEKVAATPKSATVTAPVAPSAAPAADDQLIAVITAAVAAAIESDPALSSQFASGFRVVSFKKTDKSRNR